MENNNHKLEWKKPNVVVVDLKDYEKMIIANARSSCYSCYTGCSSCSGCSGCFCSSIGNKSGKRI